MIGTAAAIGMGLFGGGLFGSQLFGQSAANAQGDAAMAQLNERMTERNQAMGFAQQGMQMAAPTSQELQALSSQLDLYNQTLNQQSYNLGQQQQLLNAVNPALMDAGHQAEQLLQGKDASVLAPIRNDRDRQRQQLVNRLQQQMGPGAETSTAGMQALNQFDQQSELVLSQNQNQAMGQLLGVSAQVKPDMVGQTNSAAGMLSGMNQNYMGNLGSLQQRQLTANSNMIAASNQTSLTPYSGAPYAGSYAGAQNWQHTFNTFGSVGAGLTGKALGQYV